MSTLQKIKIVAKNKIILYALTRYLVLSISFITSIFLAAKLGPYFYGIWGFILLLINYFQIFDFGISDSATILLIQNKDNKERSYDYQTNSIILSGLLGLIVVIVALYQAGFGISFFEKYHLGNLFYFVCIVSIIGYFNKLFYKIYRVKSKMFEFGFYQTIIPVLIFIVMFFAKERQLIFLLISSYVFGNLISLFFFIKGGGVSFKGQFNKTDSATILSKGFMLFLYNFFFYLIVLSTRTIISIYYSVEEFGYFTFSYTIAGAILVILDAFAVLIVPKVIDRLYSKDISIIQSTLSEIKISYVYVSYAMMCVAVVFYPILLIFLPKYSNTFQVINLLSIAVVFSANSFGYSMYLKAINKEKTLAKISIISLLVNILLALFLINIFKVNYSYVALSIMISFFIFTYLCVYYGNKELKQSVNFFHVFQESLPLRLLIPVLLIMLITILNYRSLVFLPLLAFILLNLKPINKIYLTIKKIFANSQIFDIK